MGLSSLGVARPDYSGRIVFKEIKEILVFGTRPAKESLQKLQTLGVCRNIRLDRFIEAGKGEEIGSFTLLLGAFDHGRWCRRIHLGRTMGLARHRQFPPANDLGSAAACRPWSPQA